MCLRGANVAVPAGTTRIDLPVLAMVFIAGSLPGRIAKSRGHPWAQAVTVAGWVTLIFGHGLHRQGRGGVAGDRQRATTDVRRRGDADGGSIGALCRSGEA